MGAFRPRVACAALLVALAAAVTVPRASLHAAAPNRLSSPSVSPTSGTTSTTFGFSVHYLGDYPATSVTAVVGSRTIALSLASGTATDGTYTGSSTLPAGTWAVTFTAVATKRNSPSISGGTVTVVAPTPSPQPSIAPVLSAAPTPAPVVATPRPKAVAPPPPALQATPVGVVLTSDTPLPVAVVPASSADAAPSVAGAASVSPGHDLVPSAFWPVMLGGFGLIGLVVAYSVFAMDRDRRRRTLAAEAALEAQRSAMVETPATPERPIAAWELDARLEEAPIGTVEYVALEDGGAMLSVSDAPRAKPTRGNPRMARIAEAREHR